MRHITDGELHLYLDGALDILEETRGEEIREHLAHCPVCHERLQDEEVLRAQAHDLLRGPGVEAGPLPSFEELRARAEVGASTEEKVGGSVESPGRYRGPLKGSQLAWAATILVALGVGWMGGQFQSSLPGDLSSRVPTMDVEPATRGAARASVTLGAEDELPVPAVDSLTNQLETPEPQLGDPGRVDAVSGSSGAVDPSTKVSAEVPAEELEREELEGVSGDLTRRLGDSLSPAPVPQFGLVEPARGRESERREAGAPGIPLGVAPDSLSSEGGSLIVPGLEVISMVWEDWFPGERALHIRQLLPMGDTLELRYLGMLIGTDPGGQPKRIPGVLQERVALDRQLSPVVMQASLPPGWNQVVMPLGRGWLVARAALPEASIRSLVNFIR